MQLTGSATFAADRARVWDLLVDPARLGPCAPIVIEPAGADRYSAKATLGIGLFSAVIRVDIEVLDIVPDSSVRIAAAGGASGTNVACDVALAMRPGPADGPVDVDWDLEVSATGMFGAQAVGLIERAAPNAIARLLDCLRGQIEG